MGEKNIAQRGCVIIPRPHSQEAAWQGFEPRVVLHMRLTFPRASSLLAVWISSATLLVLLQILPP